MTVIGGGVTASKRMMMMMIMIVEQGAVEIIMTIEATTLEIEIVVMIVIVAMNGRPVDILVARHLEVAIALILTDHRLLPKTRRKDLPLRPANHLLLPVRDKGPIRIWASLLPRNTFKTT
jgi:hypothetical protein